MNLSFLKKAFGLVILSALLGVSPIQPLQSSAQFQQPVPTAPPEKISKPSKSTPSVNFILGDTAFTLKQLRWQTQAYSGGFKPPKDCCYLTFDLDLKNDGLKATAITTVSLFQLQDAQGNPHPLTLPEDPNNANGLLKPGKQSHGTVRFTVPKVGDYELLVISPKNPDQVAHIKIEEDDFLLAGIERALESDAKEHEKVTSKQSESHMTLPLQPFKTTEKQVGELYFKIVSAKRVTKQGNHYLVLDVHVLSKSKVTQALTATTMFELQDQEGCSYKVNLPEPKASLNGLLEPGHSMNGQVIFKVDDWQERYELGILL